MIAKLVYNNENGIFNYIKEMVNKNSKEKYMVLSQIDDQAFEKIDECVSNEIDRLLICVDRYLTTKSIFVNLLNNDKYTNKYIFSNSDMQSNRLNNLIMLKSEDEMEVLIVPFCITDFNLQTSNSFAIYLKGNLSEQNVLQEIYNLYLYQMEYEKLTEKYVNDCINKKLFRNDKANNLYKDVNKDEIVQSFRNLVETDNIDETLKVIKSQNNARKFSLDRSEISFNTDEIETINTDALDNDIEINIEI